MSNINPYKFCTDDIVDESSVYTEDSGTLVWCIRHIKRISTLNNFFYSTNDLASEYFSLISRETNLDILSSSLCDLVGLDELEFIAQSVKFHTSIKNEWEHKKNEIKNDCSLDDKTAFDLLIDLITQDDYFELNFDPKTLSNPTYKHFSSTSLGEFIREDNKYFEKYLFPLKPRENKNFPLVKISDMPEWTRPCFSQFEYLNAVQSRVFNCAFETNENLLVCAPTGCGKTNIALLCILQQIKHHISTKDIRSNASIFSDIIVYISPMKALASEIVQKFTVLTISYGVIVKEVTGDFQTSKNDLENLNIMVTTPEKFDIIIRNLPYDDPFIMRVKCVIFDEIHLLNDDRGPVLESIVASLLHMMESSRMYARLIGISATLPNWEDVGTFLRAPKKNLFYFDESYRPVPLEQLFYGVKSVGNQHNNTVEHTMHDITLTHVIESLSNGHQCMVFVSGRRETISSARELINRADIKSFGSYLARVEDSSKYIKPLSKTNPILSELFERGLSIHHAGMSRPERELVENMFREGAIKVLFCTSTLAWGVNLPAHTVIIKGTMIHGCQRDLTFLELTQIMGRAGRPQYDTSGQTVLITEHNKLKMYLQWQRNSIPIESKMLLHLENALIGEISNGTITTIQDSLNWASNTFLHLRLSKNPLAYGAGGKNVLDSMKSFIKISLNNLKKRHMIIINESEFLISTELGKIVSKFYLDYETGYDYLQSLNELKEDLDYGILRIFGQSREFNSLFFRQEDVENLEYLSKRLPIFRSNWLDDTFGKVSILVLCYISNIPVYGSLRGDITTIIDSATRLFRAMFMIANSGCDKLLSSDNMLSNDSKIELSLCISRWEIMFRRRIWIDSGYSHPSSRNILLQLTNKYDPIKGTTTHSKIITESVINKISEEVGPYELIKMPISSLSTFVNTLSQAKSLKSLLNHIPFFSIRIQVQPLTLNLIKITVYGELHNNFIWNIDWNGCHEDINIWVSMNRYSNTFTTAYFSESERKFIRQIYMKGLANELDIRAYASSINWIGVFSEFRVNLPGYVIGDETIQFPLSSIIPLRIEDIDINLKKLYEFSYLNLLQTIVFHKVYHTDDTILIGAPTGSGKTLIAELSILRLLKNSPGSKVVYLVGLKDIGTERYHDWRNKFKEFSFKVSYLNSYFLSTHDIFEPDVIISTPEKWDALSRRNMHYLSDHIKLIILDEICLMSSKKGAALEAIINRFKSIQVRILGLSTTLANPECVSKWLGDAKIFNFSSSSKQVPCKIFVNSFPDKTYYTSLQNNMNVFAFKTLCNYSLNDPSIIFVLSRDQTISTAQNIANLSIASNISFLGPSVEKSKLDDICKSLEDSNLAELIHQGIAYYYNEMSAYDKRIVEDLFLRQWIYILVCTSKLAWNINLPSKIIIIKGTKIYGKKIKGHTDYSITDIMQAIQYFLFRWLEELDAIAFILVEESKADLIKSSIYSPLPIESCLEDTLIEHINAEISNKTIATKIDFLSYISNTFFYRRLIKNPLYYMDINSKSLRRKGITSNLEMTENYHNIKSTNEIILKFINSLLEETISSLNTLGCIKIQSSSEIDEFVLDHGLEFISDISTSLYTPTLLGTIASCYYISCSTAHMFKSKLNSEQELDFYQLLNLISGSQEFKNIPIRHNEDFYNMKLSSMCPVPIDESEASSPHSKTFLLLQAIMWKLPLPIIDYKTDIKTILDRATVIIHAFIDIAAVKRRLSTVLYLILIMQCLINHLNPGDINSLIIKKKNFKYINIEVSLSPLGSNSSVIPRSFGDATYIYDIKEYSNFQIRVKLTSGYAQGYYYVIIANEISGLIYGLKKITIRKCSIVSFRLSLDFNTSLKVIVSSALHVARDQELSLIFNNI
ncbi:Sec63 Brl domain [Babesia microti strain RI]|uniref:Sec63 Brl domain n=1 Tax=Babesia microti (strain RI) TaxID=1133968 RepID=A0A1N6LWJ3_BABMR|nr:Sec63 Brl domain [Babesia microti strain RI]SIO73240.1 Sec63 Brl domain [Babesia microti strain RI]|eukprot:XP_021337347.1 Sec63 Brl domain [Babesia microti strain RI]